jgi:hypothetical protein
MSLTGAGYLVSAPTGYYTVQKGRKYIVTGTLTGSTGTVNPTFDFYDEGLSQAASDSTPTLTGTFSHVITANRTGSVKLTMALGASNTASATFTGLSITPAGALWAMDDAGKHAGYQVADASGNNHPLNLPATGVEIVAPAPVGTIHAKVTTDQLLVARIPPNAIIESIFVIGFAYETVSIGTSDSYGANIVNEHELQAAGVKIPTSDILRIDSSTGEIWAYGSAACTLRINYSFR